MIAFTGENEDHGKYEFPHLQNKNDSQSVDNDSTDKRKLSEVIAAHCRGRADYWGLAGRKWIKVTAVRNGCNSKRT